MATFDSRQLSLPLNPSLSYPSISTPIHRISHHHRHHTWRFLNYLHYLPSITHDKTRRLLPHVRLTIHLLNHWKPTTKEMIPGLQAPSRNSQRERSAL